MTDKNIKIAVIGAGLAGLTAGYRLKQLGFIDVNVYEARERVGGRVLSVKLKDGGKEYVAEMGGWNLGDGGDPVFISKIAEELGLEISKHNHKIPSDIYDDGLHIDIKKLSQNFIDRVGEENLENYVKEAAQRHSNIDDFLKDILKNDEVLYKSTAFRYAGFEGGDPKDISSKLWMNFIHILHGGLAGIHQSDVVEISYIVGGNAKLALGMKDALRANVHLGHVLSAIKSEADKIQLTFKNGEVVGCDKLIFAAPLSVLEDIEVDSTLIPEDRLGFLKKIKYGTAGKILWNEVHEKIAPFIMTDGVSVFQPEAPGPIQMFVAWDAGKNLKSKHLELFQKAVGMVDGQVCTDPIVVEAADEHLKVYNDPVTHFWVNDPFAKGSYSFRSVETYDRIYEYITINNITFREPYAPIDNKVFFIGEHTAVDADIGTMEGAVESGYKVAEFLHYC